MRHLELTTQWTGRGRIGIEKSRSGKGKLSNCIVTPIGSRAISTVNKFKDSKPRRNKYMSESNTALQRVHGGEMMSAGGDAPMQFSAFGNIEYFENAQRMAMAL